MGGVQGKAIILVFLAAKQIVLSIFFSLFTPMCLRFSFLAVFIHVF